jgi:hypothetical protein
LLAGILKHGANVKNFLQLLFTKFRAFTPGKPFQSSLMFAGKARAYPIELQNKRAHKLPLLFLSFSIIKMMFLGLNQVYY